MPPTARPPPVRWASTSPTPTRRSSPPPPRRADRLLRHRHRPVVVHLRREADQGVRPDGQGAGLVRQRVGLLQPSRRLRRAGRQIASVRSLNDLLAEGVSGRRVLLRADLNVPLDKSSRAITDDGRIRASLPTLQALPDAGAPRRAPAPPG